MNVGRFLDRFGWGLSALVMTAITWASLSPPGSTGDPGHADKYMHILFFGLAVLPAASAPSRSPIHLAAAVFVWGCVIELLQPFAGRGTDSADVVANGMGVLAGLLLAYPFRAFFRRHQAKALARE